MNKERCNWYLYITWEGRSVEECDRLIMRAKNNLTPNGSELWTSQTEEEMRRELRQLLDGYEDVTYAMFYKAEDIF